MQCNFIDRMDHKTRDMYVLDCQQSTFIVDNDFWIHGRRHSNIDNLAFIYSQLYIHVLSIQIWTQMDFVPLTSGSLTPTKDIEKRETLQQATHLCTIEDKQPSIAKNSSTETSEQSLQLTFHTRVDHTHTETPLCSTQTSWRLLNHVHLNANVVKENK